MTSGSYIPDEMHIELPSNISVLPVVGSEGLYDSFAGFLRAAVQLIGALIKLVVSIIEAYSAGMAVMTYGIRKTLGHVREKLMHIFKKPPKLVTSVLQDVQIENAIPYHDFRDLLFGFTNLIRSYNSVANPAPYKEQFSTLLRMNAEDAATRMHKPQIRLTAEVLNGFLDDLYKYAGLRIAPITEEYEGISVVTGIDITSKTYPVGDRRNKSGLLSDLGYAGSNISTLYNSAYPDLNGLTDTCRDYLDKLKSIKNGLMTIESNISKGYGDNKAAVENMSARCRYLIANVVAISAINSQIVVASHDYTSWLDTIVEVMYKNVKDVKVA